jgi:DNA-binding LacI/PurR family transcriptional regulator
MKKARVTIHHVAKASGVSIATVTRVLQNSVHVNPETRRRVLDAIEELNYRPDSVARALVTGSSTGTFGLLIPTSSDAYWGEVAAGVESRARANGYSVLLGHSYRRAENEREIVELFRGKRVDGIIIGALTRSDHPWIPQVQRELPVVFIGRDVPTRVTSAPGRSSSQVEAVPARSLTMALNARRAAPEPPGVHPVFLADDRYGAQLVVKHLLLLGHRNIAFLAGQLLDPSMRMIEGMRPVLEERGLWPCAVWRCEETLEGGRIAARAVMRRRSPPTALFGYNDLIAIGAMRGVHDLGLKIPQDVSVIGFDDVESAAFVTPALTSAGIPKFELGARAVTALLSMRRRLQVPVKSELPPTGLMLRESTAAPRTHDIQAKLTS